jgi:hypothetical protein
MFKSHEDENLLVCKETFIFNTDTQTHTERFKVGKKMEEDDIFVIQSDPKEDSDHFKQVVELCNRLGLSYQVPSADMIDPFRAYQVMVNFGGRRLSVQCLGLVRQRTFCETMMLWHAREVVRHWTIQDLEEYLVKLKDQNTYSHV